MHSKPVLVVDSYIYWLDFPVIVSGLGVGCGWGRQYKQMITRSIPPHRMQELTTSQMKVR